MQPPCTHSFIGVIVTIELLCAATLLLSIQSKNVTVQNSMNSCYVISFSLQIPGIKVEADEINLDTVNNLLRTHGKVEQFSQVTSTVLTTPNHDEAQSTHHTELSSQHDLNDDNSTSNL